MLMLLVLSRRISVFVVVVRRRRTLRPAAVHAVQLVRRRLLLRRPHVVQLKRRA